MLIRYYLIALLLTTTATAQESAVAPPLDANQAVDANQKLASVTKTMQDLVDAGKVAGSIAMVAHHGRIVYFDSVGVRDIQSGEPMEQDTIVRIFSMTKPITSVAAMMLVEQGKLDLDDPVAKYLPELKDVEVFVAAVDGDFLTESPKTPMTIRDLLRHTSGLTYGFFGNTAIDKTYVAANVLGKQTSLSEMVTKLGSIPLLYQPGTKFNYSVSSDVLGRVVEVASGETLDVFFAEHIFQPLKMIDTGFNVPKAKRHRFATTHGYATNGDLVVCDAAATSPFLQVPGLLSGGGGLVSTATDYMQFCQMLLNDGQLAGKRLLKAETIAEMTRNQLPKSAYPIGIGGNVRNGVGFGLGFSVIVEKTAYTRLNHLNEYGWGGAASTHFWISEKDDLAVVVLTQLQPYSAQMEIALKPVIYQAIESKPK